MCKFICPASLHVLRNWPDTTPCDYAHVHRTKSPFVLGDQWPSTATCFSLINSEVGSDWSRGRHCLSVSLHPTLNLPSLASSPLLMREGAKDASSADQGQDQRRQLESGGRFKAILLSVNSEHTDGQASVWLVKIFSHKTARLHWIALLFSAAALRTMAFGLIATSPPEKKKIEGSNLDILSYHAALQFSWTYMTIHVGTLLPKVEYFLYSNFEQLLRFFPWHKTLLRRRIVFRERMAEVPEQQRTTLRVFDTHFLSPTKKCAMSASRLKLHAIVRQYRISALLACRTLLDGRVRIQGGEYPARSRPNLNAARAGFVKCGPWCLDGGGRFGCNQWH